MKKNRRLILIRISKSRFKKRLKRNELRKLIRVNRHYKNELKEQKLRRKPKKNKFITISPPENFSLINNPHETLEYFKKIRMLMIAYEPIHVEMANIKKMTGDALIYQLALMQKIKLDLSGFYIKGSFPKEEKVLSLMRASGFLHYFKTSKDNIITDSDFIEIKSGKNVDNETVKKICLFVIDKLQTDRNKTKPLFDIISEMMLNTKQHAYNTSDQEYSNWMLFLRFYPEKQSIDFIFMDTGYGIPQTVRKTKLEQAKKWFSNMGFDAFNQSDLVKSALDGAYRTQTGKGYRGRGLPRIFKYYNSGYIKNLNLFSNKACLTFNDEYHSHDLKTEIIGTLIYWKLTKESINGNN